ncbi:MAG: glutathione S-transferase family protein [Parvularculaceae bacterium]
MAKLKIYGDCRSGNCLKVRWTADHLGVDYEWIDVDLMNGSTRTDEYLALNPIGQVPCLLLPDGRALAQSNAIVAYLASLTDCALLPTDAYERAKVDEWLFWEQNSHEPCVAERRFLKVRLGKSDDEIDPQLFARGRRALGHMELQLAATHFLAGERMTVADIVVAPYTRVAPEGGFDLGEFPNIRAWIARVERELSLPPVTEAA